MNRANDRVKERGEPRGGDSRIDQCSEHGSDDYTCAELQQDLTEIIESAESEQERESAAPIC